MKFELFVNNVSVTASGPGLSIQNISLVGVPGANSDVAQVSMNLSSPNTTIKSALVAGQKIRVTLDPITE